MHFSFEVFDFVDLSIDPDKLAFACADGDLSWKQLRELANEKVHFFQQMNLQKGEPLLIYGHKEIDYIVYITAALMYGLPYIPMDISAPQERVKSVLEQSGARVMVDLSNTDLIAEHVVTLNKLSSPEKLQVIENPVFCDPSVAYIIFTSGSTGKPKGVIISREALHNFTQWMCKEFPVNKTTIFINQAPFSFDLSLVELCGNLCLGSSTILNTAEVSKNPPVFMERIHKYKGNLWHSTPSFALLVSTAHGFDQNALPHIKDFIFIGEELTSRVVKRIKSLFPTSKVYNAYGPSEATYAVTICEITSSFLEQYSSSLPVGFLKQDCVIIPYDTNSGKLLSNEGAEGEVVIHGLNVSNGYLNNPEQTNQRFMEIEGKRFYLTGDYGFIREGLLFFNGRRDDQVKMGGFRIELGEINEVIAQFEKVIECITIPFKAGNQVKKIVSFIKGKNDLDKEKLVHYLQDKLPSYMMPGEIVVVREFVYNNNLKIDKNQLMQDYINGAFLS